jgi:hypothetical protein
MSGQKGSKLPTGCEEEAMAAEKTMRKIIQDEDDAFQKLAHFFPHASVHSATGALLKPGRSRPVVLYGWAKTMAQLLNTEKECKMYYGMNKENHEKLAHSEDQRVALYEENLRLTRLHYPTKGPGTEEEEEESTEREEQSDEVITVEDEPSTASTDGATPTPEPKDGSSTAQAVDVTAVKPKVDVDLTIPPL